MKTVSITRYSQLTRQQWLRVVRTAKRQIRERTSQDCDIGLGRKFRNDRPYGWQIALRIYLPKKRKRVARSRLIPRHLEIRLKRNDGKFDLLRIRTDVESRSRFLPTGFNVKLSDRGRATTGVLFRWSDPGEPARWGLVTVAHLFDGTRRRTTSVRLDNRTRLSCRRLRTASRRSGLDAAALQIVGDAAETESLLIGCGLISDRRSAAIRPLTTRQVQQAAVGHRRGRTFPPGASHVFTGEEIFPDGFRLGERSLDSCVRVSQSTDDVFQKGTSGSYWRFGRRAACLQVGGRKPGWREGIGQPLAEILHWLRKRISDTVEIVSVF
jgi:hypothetical protein